MRVSCLINCFPSLSPLPSTYFVGVPHCRPEGRRRLDDETTTTVAPGLAKVLEAIQSMPGPVKLPKGVSIGEKTSPGISNAATETPPACDTFLTEELCTGNNACSWIPPISFPPPAIGEFAARCTTNAPDCSSLAEADCIATNACRWVPSHPFQTPGDGKTIVAIGSFAPECVSAVEGQQRRAVDDEITTTTVSPGLAKVLKAINSMPGPVKLPKGITIGDKTSPTTP